MENKEEREKNNGKALEFWKKNRPNFFYNFDIYIWKIKKTDKTEKEKWKIYCKNTNGNIQNERITAVPDEKMELTLRKKYGMIATVRMSLPASWIGGAPDSQSGLLDSLAENVSERMILR